MKYIRDFIFMFVGLLFVAISIVLMIALAVRVYTILFEPIKIDAYTPPVSYTSLEVVNNYGYQRTANINVLEPKVSSEYLQYGSYR
jgi:hypothetical protein